MRRFAPPKQLILDYCGLVRLTPIAALPNIAPPTAL
jgi:hypothetical protein